MTIIILHHVLASLFDHVAKALNYEHIEICLLNKFLFVFSSIMDMQLHI